VSSTTPLAILKDVHILVDLDAVGGGPCQAGADLVLDGILKTRGETSIDGAAKFFARLRVEPQRGSDHTPCRSA
jgi:hypothetical protein